VFPEAPEEKRVELLWEQILALSRINQADAVAGWHEHIRRLTSVAKYLTARQYTALHYRAPGTNLRVGLPQSHLWEAGEAISANGINFAANIPTEEVFTLPHREQAEGYVTASMPLNLSGMLVEEFSFKFENGRVSRVNARTGEHVLRKLVETDEGAARLGEVALVPHSSPISQSGRLYYNTLYDENAASHLALGRAYTSVLQGGDDMSGDEFMQAGGNRSLIHVDFMIGSAGLDIDGLEQDGSRQPVMRQGEWAFEL
jgi:aminopeptidase